MKKPAITSDDEARQILYAEAERLGITVEQLLDPLRVVGYLQRSRALCSVFRYLAGQGTPRKKT